MSNRKQELAEGYARKIVEEIATNWAPGISMSADAAGMTEAEADQVILDTLAQVREELDGLMRGMFEEAIEQGKNVRLPL